MARLRRTGEAANWKALKTGIIHAVPERLKEAPYQVKSIAIRDACRAMSEVKRRNKALGPGLSGGEYHELRFRSRKNPKQGCFVPATAVPEHGTYYTKLGKLRMAERLPVDHGDSRLTLHNGQYHLVVTMPSRRRVGETQARVVALDPGIRNFLTWFSETDAGHIAPGAFGKMQRLCAHLDGLLSRAKLDTRRLAKRNKYRAAARMRTRIENLIDELHPPSRPLAGGPLRHHPAAGLRDLGNGAARSKKAPGEISPLHTGLRPPPVPAIPQVEVLADRQAVAAGQRGLYQQDL